jgi:hypothetical protein
MKNTANSSPTLLDHGNELKLLAHLKAHAPRTPTTRSQAAARQAGFAVVLVALGGFPLNAKLWTEDSGEWAGAVQGGFYECDTGTRAFAMRAALRETVLLSADLAAEVEAGTANSRAIDNFRQCVGPRAVILALAGRQQPNDMEAGALRHARVIVRANWSVISVVHNILMAHGMMDEALAASMLSHVATYDLAHQREPQQRQPGGTL